MAIFIPGVPVETEERTIKVEVDANNLLGVGQHRFQLIVVDDSGNESLPANLLVLVVDNERPNAVIDGPSRVPFGEGFELSGERSFDVGGSIRSFRWTLLD